MIELTSGANTGLAGRQIAVQVSSARGSIDLLALLLDGSGQAVGDSIVFYNNPVSPDGAVKIDAEERRLTAEVDGIVSGVERILIVVEADGVSTLAQCGELRLEISADGTPIAGFTSQPPGFSTVQLGELYRRGGQWKVRALGDGYAAGLPRLLAVHGIEVDEAPEAASPPPSAAPTPAPEPPARQLQPSTRAAHSGSSAGPIDTRRPARGAKPARPAEVETSASAGPIDTRRPGRHRADAQEPSAPGTPADAPRVVPEPGMPTLQAAEQAIAVRYDVNARGIKVWNLVARDTLDAFAAAEEDRKDLFKQARLLDSEIIRCFDGRWKSTKQGRIRSGLAPTAATWSADALKRAGLDSWISEASAELQALVPVRAALTDGGRSKQSAPYRAALGPLLGRRLVAEQGELLRMWQAAQNRGAAAAEAAYADMLGQMRDALENAPPLPPIVGSLAEGSYDESLIPGVGRIRVRVGYAVPTMPQIRTRRPTPSHGGFELQARTLDAAQRGQSAPIVNRHDPRDVGPFGFPLILDVDVAGGLHTNHQATANNLLLRMLGLLPAGQMRATIFDPARLGDSASFLFGLGDAAETVIGSKVRTTERELGDLLNDFEEHITFVTQKYLQGTYESLTEYNVAAGEVAEPYRVLVLYDYPKGFIRADGHVDRESLARLQKIIGAGRRCGVFVVVVTPPGSTASQDVWDAVEELPYVPDGELLSPAWMTHMLSGRTTAALAARMPEGTEQVDGPVFPKVGGGFDQTPTDLAAAAASGAPTPLFATDFSMEWRFAGEAPAPESTAADILAGVKRGLAQADDVKVDPEQVARLARARVDRDVAQGVAEREHLPLPSDPESWWHGSTANGVYADFGRVGATDVARLPLDNGVPGVVIGGRPGSGKSVLLHALIESWVTRYGPEELQLYLVDFKEGVEFKSYATGGLPQAAVVAIESDRDFGVSVLRRLVDEIARRGALFKSGTGEDIGIAQYRTGAGSALPRIVCVIDEFHVLFERDDRTASDAGELMEKVVRLGRAFGVHLVLASQTLSGTAGLGRHTLGLLPGRIALQSSDADSRLLLADDNADARLLNRPGEGILNLRGGVTEANQRFQAAFSSADRRTRLVAGLRERADREGFTQRPTVFEGSVPVAVGDINPSAFEIEPTGTLKLPVGLPLTLDGPVIAELRREPGGNLLLVADEDPARGTLGVLAGTLSRGGVAVDIIDFGSLDALLALDFERLAGVPNVNLVRRRAAAAALTELRDEVTGRQEQSDFRAPARVLLLASLHRARDFEISEEAELLEQIVRDGADVGVHVITWLDKAVSVGRRLPSSVVREFGVRLVGVMGRDDAFALTESDLPTQITDAQLVLDDHERATTIRLRRILHPGDDWLTQTADVVS